MTDYLFIPTPISEKPKEERKYRLVKENGKLTMFDWPFANGEWELPACQITHYLRKVPRQEWEAGFAEWCSLNAWYYDLESKVWHKEFEESQTTADLLQTYLETI